MRQEPCPAFFLKIGPQAAKVGPGFRPDRRSSGGAKSDKVGQALCLPRPRGGKATSGSSHKNSRGGEASPPRCLALRIHLSSPQNLSSITAAWARVAVPWGLRVEPSPVPLMIPAPQAHCRAGMAYSAASKASA